MTTYKVFTQRDDDPRKDGKRCFIRRYNDDGSTDVVAADVRPEVAPLYVAAPDMLDQHRMTVASLNFIIEEMRALKLQHTAAYKAACDRADVIEQIIAKATGQ